MTTDTITVNLDDSFLGDIDSIVKKEGYHNRTEFIRDALRSKIKEIKIKNAMMDIAHLKGASKIKTSETEFDKNREKAFDELSKRQDWFK